MRKLALVLILPFALSGCLAYQQFSERYGHSAPAPARAIATSPASLAPSKFYVAPSQVDLTALLPPPPAPGSAAQERDMRAVLAAQKARTLALAKEVEADANATIYRFADVLGPNFNETKLPVTTAFFRKVRKNVSAFGDITKTCYQRPRPFVADSHVHPPGDMLGWTKNNPKREDAARPLVPQGPGTACPPAKPLPTYSYSYPSGHSTFGAMTAILLSDMIPEKRQELFARGWSYGEERVIAGVHFPSDVEAGRIQATVIIALMMQNPQFKADLAEAKVELRDALGYAP